MHKKIEAQSIKENCAGICDSNMQTTWNHFAFNNADSSPLLFLNHIEAEASPLAIFERFQSPEIELVAKLQGIFSLMNYRLPLIYLPLLLQLKHMPTS
jgi:hypothetical protein